MAVFRTIPAGDLSIVKGRLARTSGVELVRQKLSVRFNFWAGEWFLDQRLGIPYLRDVLVKNPNLDLIRALLLRVVTTCPGVVSVQTFDLDYQPSPRRLSLAFEATGTDGPIIVAPGDSAFLLDVAA